MGFLTKKSIDVDGLEETKAWEKTKGWNNPFENDEEDRQRQHAEERRQRKKKKKRTSSRRHHMTAEEYSELSSQADTMLDDLLAEDDVALDGSTLGAGTGGNPFEETEAEEEMGGDEIDRDEFVALMSGVIPETPDTFSVEDAYDDLDSTLPPPPVTTNNPFDDETEEDSYGAPRKPVMTGDMVHKSSTLLEALSRKPTDTTGESESESPVDEDGEEDEDVVESSKRLLRMADQRLQYQQNNDEIRTLREKLERMKHQAEAMSEQLRRAVETKCDLVLSQTELERNHERAMIAKEEEIKEIKKYIQELVDFQAKSDLCFMNEISNLSKQMQDMCTMYKDEITNKDAAIAKLEAKVQSMGRTEQESIAPQPIATGMSLETFRAIFAPKEGSPRAPIPCL
jgi:hypothetical protein